MPSALPFRLARTLAVLGFLTCTSVDAATFTAISQMRSVAIGGQITIVDQDNGDTFQASLAPGAQTAPGDFSVFDESFGLGDLVLENALGVGRGAGRAAQTSSIGGQVIRFDGAADVFMSGEVFGNAAINASGAASSRFEYRFSVAEATPVILAMQSEVGPNRSDYTFLLRSDAGNVVWADTVLFDDAGNEIRSFSRSLLLAAGVYQLDAVLTASSAFDNNFGSSGRAVGAFTITAVPEADTWTMMVGGMLAMGFVVRRRIASDQDRRITV
jgi:hypothetical protein